MVDITTNIKLEMPDQEFYVVTREHFEAHKSIGLLINLLLILSSFSASSTLSFFIASKQPLLTKESIIFFRTCYGLSGIITIAFILLTILIYVLQRIFKPKLKLKSIIKLIESST